MNYPFWDVPYLSSGWVIGLIAIYHVMISHFAVGGGIYLPMAEQKALREGRRDWLLTLRGHAKFFLILTGVFGAVSGVGIWFSIGLAQPEGTSTLIHNFVFGWAIEWVFFLVELSAAAVYYYTWDRIPDKLHLKVGWLYAASSFLTLFIINGILSFMLTPGQPWLDVAGKGLESSRFFQAFFNPMFWPCFFIRVLACLSLAGVWALFTCSRIDANKNPGLKRSLVRWSAKWLMPAFVLMPLCLLWYLWILSASQKELLQLGVSTIGVGAFTQLTRTVLIVVISSATIVGVVYFFAYSYPLEFKPAQAGVILFLALVVVASNEYSREMLRKPFVISQHMYSNGIRKSDVAGYNKDGYLTASLWTRQTNDAGLNLAKGEAICRGQCLSCHTIDGYRSIRKVIAWRNRESLDSVLTMLHEYKPESQFRKYMPQLVGTKEEIQALGDYLISLNATPELVKQASK